MPSYSDLFSPCTCPLLPPLLLIVEAQRTLVVAARLGCPRQLTRWSAVRHHHTVRGRLEADLIIWNGLVLILHTDWSKCRKVISRLLFPFGCKLENSTIACFVYLCILSVQCKAALSQENIIVVQATVARHQTLISCDVWSINITKCKICELQREQIFGCMVCCDLG